MYKKHRTKRNISEQISIAGNEVITLSKNNNFEYGIGINKDGIILEAITSYSPKDIRIPEDYLKDILCGTFIHNHNEGFSLSLADFKVAHKGKFEIYARVVKSSQKDSQGFYGIKDAYKCNLYKVEKLFKRYYEIEKIKTQRNVKKGVIIDYISAYKNIEHIVWKRIKRRLLIDYFWIGIEYGS